MTLFKCTLECKIKGMPGKVEYLRASNEDQLITMFDQCEDYQGSTYYGYKWNEIKPMKLSDFPEIMSIDIE